MNPCLPASEKEQCSAKGGIMSCRTCHWAVLLAVSLPLLLAHQRQTLPDAYKASGRKNPKWDDAAVKALDALAHHFTNAAVGVMYQVGGALSNPELLKLSQAAVDAGCDDPLVLYCHAVAL